MIDSILQKNIEKTNFFSFFFILPLYKLVNMWYNLRYNAGRYLFLSFRETT